VTTTAGTPTASNTPAQREEKLTAGERWMWSWPILVIAAMALFSQLYGVLGVIASGVVVTTGLVLFTGSRAHSVPRRWLLPTALTACVLAGAVVVAGQFGFISDKPVGASSSTRSRDLPSADELRNTPSPGASLVGVSLDEQNLRGARLQGASAPGASLVKAILEDAKLAGADLRGANLQGARLSGADMRGVNLTGADLRGALLTNTCLRGANLTGALMQDLDASGAAVEDAVVPAVQVSTAKVWPTSTSAVPTACPS
jgi:hypothetical protein